MPPAQSRLKLARETARTQAGRAELIERIARAVPADGRVEPLPGLHLIRRSAPTGPVHSLSPLAFCVVAQGRKVILLGGRRYPYDPAHYLLTTIEMPIESQVVAATAAQPYLSLRLDLDPALVGSVLVEAGHLPARRAEEARAIDVSPLDDNLLEAAVRLVRLIETPGEGRFMAPLITREIVYRLLRGEQGERLRQIALLGGQMVRITQVVERLREELDQPLRIESLARELGMSVSGFHHHFKAVTAMSPLQFQKRLRLQEARRLMLAEGLDAAGAAYRVGYHDAAHFTREYKSLFGLPPRRDLAQFREHAAD